MKIKAAAIQMKPKKKDKAYNVERMFTIAQEAVDKGARLLVTHEMITTGYCWKNRFEIENLELAEEVPEGSTIKAVEGFARKNDCYFVIGMIEKEEERLYNTLAVVGPEGYIDKYRKIHLFPAECKWSKQGDLGPKVIETPIGNLGLAVCLDTMYVELQRVNSLNKADILCFAVQWPAETIIEPTWINEAFDNNVHVVVANRKGEEDGFVFLGGSAVINPDGDILDCFSGDEGFAMAEINIENKRKVEFVPERRPELYKELQQPTMLWKPELFFNMYGESIPEGGDIEIGAVQFEPAKGDLKGNISRIIEHVQCNPDVELMVFPELSISGRPDERVEAVEMSLEYESHEIKELVDSAKKHDTNLIVGFILREGDRIFNALAAINKNGKVDLYRKSHLGRRDRHWADQGDESPLVVDFDKARVGTLIGEEIFVPELARLAAVKGCDVISTITDLEFSGRNYDGLEDNGLFWHVGRCKKNENNIVSIYSSSSSYTGIFAPNEWGMSMIDSIIETGEGIIRESVNTSFFLETGGPNVIRSKPLIAMRQPLWYDRLYKD